MKKYMIIILCVCITFCFSACGSDQNNSLEQSGSSNVDTVSQLSSDNADSSSISNSINKIPPSENAQDNISLGNVIIFGDSYSTFEGWLPEGYSHSYSEDGYDGNEVIDVRDTWWYKLISETNSNLVMNNSWSGSTIGYTGYNGKDLSRSKSFIYRFQRLLNIGFFENNKVDTVIIFGGTNDSWSQAPVGELMFSDWEREDLYSVLPAICYYFNLVTESLPDARIVCLVNTDLDEKITDGMCKAAEHYGIEKITFETIDKQKGHPTIKGMEQISNGIIEYLNSTQSPT